MNEHTATPWHIESVAVGAFKSVVSLVSATEGKVTNITCSDADAKLIVRAVNAHDALIEALNSVVELSLTHSGDPYIIIGRLGEIAEEALKLAHGE